MRDNYLGGERRFIIPNYHDLGHIDLSIFPLIEDFYIAPRFGEIPMPAWKDNLPHLTGASFCSRSEGVLCGSQWWESLFYLNKIKSQFTAQNIPIGTFKNPCYFSEFFEDMAIFEQGKHVHILKSSRTRSELFDVCFRVHTWNYTQAWLEVFSKLQSERYKVRTKNGTVSK